MYDWVNAALDIGITEERFWNMTLAEIRREADSRQRVMRQQARDKASYDYLLADLIGRSVGRIYSKNTRMPKLYEVYPSLFTKEEIEVKQQERQAELFALRLKQLSASHNKKLKQGGGEG